MMRTKGRAKLGVVLLAGAVMTAGVAGTTGPVLAAAGDVHAVKAERANLRSGPTDDASIRSTVTRGDELVEVRRDGEWIGVRVMRTGEEGWIFGDLLERRVASTLGSAAPTPPETPQRKTAEVAGFQRLSPGFAKLLARLDDQFGYRFAEKVDQTSDNTLKVVPTEAWVYSTSREAKVYAAVALYQMWKSYHNGRPVSLSLGRPNAAAITIEDMAEGPELGLPMMGSSR